MVKWVVVENWIRFLSFYLDSLFFNFFVTLFVFLSCLTVFLSLPLQCYCVSLLLTIQFCGMAWWVVAENKSLFFHLSDPLSLLIQFSIRCFSISLWCSLSIFLIHCLSSSFTVFLSWHYFNSLFFHLSDPLSFLTHTLQLTVFLFDLLYCCFLSTVSVFHLPALSHIFILPSLSVHSLFTQNSLSIHSLSHSFTISSPPKFIVLSRPLSFLFVATRRVCLTTIQLAHSRTLSHSIKGANLLSRIVAHTHISKGLSRNQSSFEWRKKIHHWHSSDKHTERKIKKWSWFSWKIIPY